MFQNINKVLSIINQSDMFSFIDDHHELFTNYAHMAFGDLVKVIHSYTPASLIRARLTGCRHASGDVIAFFDSHQEVQVGWQVVL